MDFRVLSTLIFCFVTLANNAQYKLTGTVLDAATEQPIEFMQLYDKTSGKEAVTNANGGFALEGLNLGLHTIVFYNDNYAWYEKTFIINTNTDVTVKIEKSNALSEVVIQAKKREVFDLKRAKDVEGTTIYAGKKTEVILVDQIIGNKSNSNARQIYAQVAGLNIYESTNCGLQLSIGGRGLDPNRTANFNTRQNGYDISADVLGYPESYYTPPAEALEEIQLIRGAASLQYGTQFGGLINFKLKSPSAKPLEIVTRQSYDTNCGFATFNSFSGTNGKLSHYSYVSYKNNLNEAPRDNMGLEAFNAYTNINYQLSSKTAIGLEYTHLSYTAQQSGGLTDVQFYRDPTFSNRTRNWFRVNWNLLTAKFNHEFSENERFNAVFWGMNSSRSAIGFRTNRVSQVDNLDEPRDLQVGNFRNWGAELRYLKNYTIGKKKSTLLLGSKYYQAFNEERQGPGTNGRDANFNFIEYAVADLPTELRQSDFNFPNLNASLFAENIFYVSNKLSITPGIRFEYIKTESEGTFRAVNRDLAGNALLDSTFEDNRTRERNILLLGLGLSYKPNTGIEFYGNLSQNYRSVTFNDIRIVNPSFQVDENIDDESGFTAGLGLRGRYKKLLSYDANVFGLWYKDRIDEVIRTGTRINAFGETVENGRVIRFRGNIGDALIYGFESLVDWNIRETFFKNYKEYKFNYYVNLAVIQSEFTASEISGVEGNELPFVPQINLRTGIKLGYRNLLMDVQYSYLSSQFTDASNALQNSNDNVSGIIGAIPSYSVFDLSLSYRYRKWTLEAGINNVLNEQYFTQRATGYPGPGIIPALPRSYYTTLQLKL
ncbi:TonB-dependent receptor domain-containing protein [Jejuia pallidilutea]|uniref:Iron(III) dicitrate transport protein FecA n=1 Tax=Jejuia pallidilutea TaxID=504487 RepID=A0A090WGN4_9FLAO|nr:TonB-dependent receptor [Jejuia pallidilutea]GAL66677.1 iron(III) dicitrate transport protein FecA [Jejuia pallidilutea]GAL69938.1 iron(III) dicitrate transport protein FecA [Jejuia pallidilutea]GAL90949.1 iron(III) dicitrate transport protein FecA [Jejuia pallidilutea]